MLVRNLRTLWVGQLLSKGITFVAMAVLARRVSTADYGAIEYAFGLATLAALAMEGGLGAVGVRRLTQGLAPRNELSSLVLSGQFALALAIAPIAMVCGWLFTDDSTASILSMVILATTLLLPFRQEWLFQSHGLMGPIVASQLIRTVLFAVGVALMIGGSSNVIFVGAIEAAAVSVATIYMIVTQARMICPVGLRLKGTAILDLYREGAPIAGSAIFWAATQYAPLLVFASQSSMADTAKFGAAHRIGVSLITFSWLYHFNLFPVIARRIGAGNNSHYALSSASLRVTSWFGAGAALALALCSESLVVAFFGEPYRDGAPILGALVWTFPLTIISGHARWSLVASGFSRDVLTCQVLGALMAAAAAWLLIPSLGAVGAAAAMTLACLLVWLVSHVYCVIRKVEVPLVPALAPMVVGMAIAVAGLALDFGVVLEAVVGIGTFAAVGLLLDTHLVRDLKWILRFNGTEHGPLSGEPQVPDNS